MNEFATAIPVDKLPQALPRPAPFGVYIHWPFCAAKCPYCDFNSHVRFGVTDQAGYLASYRRELAHMAALAPGRTVSSIFFGGGTPSLMEPATVAGILDQIAALWPVAADAEVTLEANPSSVEAGRFLGYRIAGVNRVSLGVQALDDRDLKALGRLHDRAGALAALDIARRTFSRVTFDLIYARTGQTLSDWRRELNEALAMAAGHMSLYQLTIEHGTPFAALHAAGKLQVPELHVAAEMYELTQELTASAGLPAYEISNHAQPGEESRHNLLYWRYGEYAGIGPGAHGRLIVDGTRMALSVERMPEAWAAAVARQGHGLLDTTPLSAAEEADERLLMGLRLAEGVDLQALAAATGYVPESAALRRLIDAGWIERCDATSGGPPRLIRATVASRLVLNEVVARLSASLETVPPR